jgi:hypothetical protein
VRLKKTYIDSGVLINAFRGTTKVSLKATQILDDPTREFARITLCLLRFNSNSHLYLHSSRALWHERLAKSRVVVDHQ